MQEIKLESLDDGPGILPFKLGSARFISHYHSFLQDIDLQKLQNKVISVNDQIDNFSPQLHNKTNALFEPHLDYLKNKLVSVLEQVETFQINRVKRGLVDGLGSVVKSITGNLDYSDALRYNQAIKSLEDNENKLVTELNSHVSLSKNWTLQYTKILDTITDNQNKIEMLLKKIHEAEASRDNDLVKYAHLAQTLMILTDNVDSISQELLKLQNILAFIRASTTHHSVLNLYAIRDIIRKLKVLYGSERVVDLDIREYFDIIKLGSYYVGNSLVIVYKIPIVLPSSYNMYKLSIIPNKNHEILIPPFPYLAIHEKDFKYIEAECPKTSKWYLCEEKRNQPNRSPDDCIQHLISTQQRNNRCSPTTISLSKSAYEELDEKHYSISFPVSTKVHLSCGQDLYQTLQGSYLAIIPQQCYIETPEFTISNIHDRLKGQALKIMDLPKSNYVTPSSTPIFKLNSINLNQLHATNKKISLQSPLQLDANNDYALYHTTIPMYLLLSGACALTCGLLYRKYRPTLRKKSHQVSEESQAELQGVYALPIPTIRGVDPNPVPAQFTTNFNTRCSSGGGVTQGCST